MKKLNINLIEINNIRIFCGEVSGTLNDLKTGMKIQERCVISDEDLDKAGTKKDEAGQRDTSKIDLTYKKEIELSKDEEKLLKKALTDYFERNKEKNLKDQGIQNALAVDKIMS